MRMKIADEMYAKIEKYRGELSVEEFIARAIDDKIAGMIDIKDVNIVIKSMGEREFPKVIYKNGQPIATLWGNDTHGIIGGKHRVWK